MLRAKKKIKVAQIKELENKLKTLKILWKDAYRIKYYDELKLNMRKMAGKDEEKWGKRDDK